MTTRRYECWYAVKDGTVDEMTTQIQSVYPNLNVQAVEDHTSDPQITPGKALVTLADVDGDFHRDILAIPGVTSFD
jgi:hypothetical protein